MHATRAIRGHRPREEESRCGSCFLSSAQGLISSHNADASRRRTTCK